MARVSDFFLTKTIFWGEGGWRGMELVNIFYYERGGGARVSDCFTLNPNLKNIEDIYFFEGNTKYISSNVMKISVNSRVRSTGEFSNIFDK